MPYVVISMHVLFAFLFILVFQENKTWYQTLWDFAWGKYLYRIWRQALSKQENETNMNLDPNAIQNHSQNKEIQTSSLKTEISSIHTSQTYSAMKPMERKDEE